MTLTLQLWKVYWNVLCVSLNITITVDWALKTNYLSIRYIFLYDTDIATVKGEFIEMFYVFTSNI